MYIVCAHILCRLYNYSSRPVSFSVPPLYDGHTSHFQCIYMCPDIFFSFFRFLHENHRYNSPVSGKGSKLSVPPVAVSFTVPAAVGTASWCVW